MKSTGIVRRIDELGRIVLPAELRRTLNIGERETMEIFVDGSSIVLKKYSPFQGQEHLHPLPPPASGTHLTWPCAKAAR